MTVRVEEQRDFAPSIGFVLGFATSIALGYWGWSSVDHHFKDAAHLLGRVYLTLQLFVLHPQDLPGTIPWQLQVARFLAPTVLALATIALITARFRWRLRHVWFRHFPGHVIVCGAGVHGARLAQNLTRADKRVVLVDVDEHAPGMRGPRRRREHRFVADAVRPDTLLSAGLHCAERLIAVTGDDVVNSQIASTVRSLASTRKTKREISILVQAEDAALARFLETQDASDDAQDGAARDARPAPARRGIRPPKIEVFGANAIAADALFGNDAEAEKAGEDGNGIFRHLGSDEAGPLLLVGDHPLLDAIVVASLRRARARRLRETPIASTAATPALRITLIGPKAESSLAAIARRSQPEPTLVELAAADVDLRDEDAISTSRWLREWREASHALIACEDELDSIALSVALSRALGKGVRLTRVRTQPRNELDRRLQSQTLRSAHLATITVHSIADLAWGEDACRIDDIAAPRRLAAALRAEGLQAEDAEQAARRVFAQPWLGIHSNPAPRVRPTSAAIVRALLRAAGNGDRATASVSALVNAGLIVDLDSRSNVRRAAEQLADENNNDAFAAWCEYARQTPERPAVATELLSLARAAPKSRVALKLKAAAILEGAALDGLEPDAAIVEEIRSRSSSPIAIFAGGAASMSGETERAVAKLLERALYRYEGLLLTGGSDVGLCGAVRSAARMNGAAVLGYAPADRGLASAWSRTTAGGEFSEAEPVAMWTDLLAAGRSAADVRVVAFPGGSITTTEILLARALSAPVASLDPCEELSDALDDALPFGADGIVEFPADPMTLRAFLTSSNAVLDPTLRECAARALHNQYRERQKKHKRADDPALAPWERLPPALRRSNFAAVDDIPNKLHLVGKRISKGGARLVFSDDEVELLAEMEHGRFNCERLSAGWKLGRSRRVSRLISPYLIPWDDLDEETKQWDRDAVRAIERALCEAGWGVALESRPGGQDDHTPRTERPGHAPDPDTFA